MKRILSMLLCLALVIGFIPAVARAAETETVTMTSANLGLSNATDFTKWTSPDGNITFTAAKNGGSNAPKYYTDGSSLRFYNKNLLTITPAEGYTIDSISFTTPGSSYNVDSETLGNADYDGTNKITPVVGADPVTITVGSSQVRIKTMTVIYKAVGGSEGGETPNPEPDTPAAGGSYKLVTDASTLKAGDKVVIVAKDYAFALSTTQKDNNRDQAAVTKNNGGTLGTLTDNVQVMTLEAGSVTGTFAFNVGIKGYLCAASSGSNYLRSKTTKDANSSWKITIASDGTATIVAQGSYTRNTMQYNQSSSLFACYASASQKALCIYKLQTGCEHVFTDKASNKQATPATCTAAATYYVACDKCGEVGTKTVVVGNPSAHTYTNGVCSCGDKAIKMASGTLLYENNIQVRIKFSLADTTADEKGMIIFSNSSDAAAHTNPVLICDFSYDGNNDCYYGYSQGIVAKDMGISAYYVGYAKYGDTYVYTDVLEYSPKIYAQNMLNSTTSAEKTKNLCAALLHYGAAAQKYFDNSLTAEQLMNYNVANLPAFAYDESVLGTSKFDVETGEVNGFTVTSANILFDDAITYRIKYIPSAELQGKDLNMEFFIGDIYSAVPINEAGYAYIERKAPKDMDDVIVCTPYYLEADGITKVCGPTLTYSGYEYARRTIENSNDENMIALAKAFAMYIYYANGAFAN